MRDQNLDLIYDSQNIQSRWNSFRIIYDDNYKLFFRYSCIIQTKRLGIFRLNDDRLDRLKWIKHLSDSGMSTKEISEYLNQHNIKTPRGLTYYPKLVWVTLFKYKKRLQREFNDERIKSTESLVVRTRKLLRSKVS